MGKVLVLSFVALVLVVVIHIANGEYEKPPPDLPETDEDEDEYLGKRSPGDVYESPPPEWPETDEDYGRRKRFTPPEGQDYALAVGYSILFYEAQRSGKLPADNRIPWRGDSALNDQGENGEDLTGGWYDAGDHVKFNFPMAFSTTLLAWGVIEFEDAYKSAGELENVRKSIKWTCDYFIKCHTAPEEYYYQVGDPGIDHQVWDRSENMTMERPASKCYPTLPCSDVAAETAAALTTCSIVFEDVDPDYSAECLRHAKELYKFAYTHQGCYPLEVYYKSSSFWDELAWAAVWLYKATNERNYLIESQNIYLDHNLKPRAYAFGWGDKKPGVQLLLYNATKDEGYLNRVRNYVDNWLPGKRLSYSSQGFVVRNNWGSDRYAASTTAVAVLAARYMLYNGNLNDPRNVTYVAWAKDQIDYILGDNESGRSYMIGYGDNYPRRPHHRASSCPDLSIPCTSSNSYKNPGPNHHELKGAVVGGVDNNDWWSDNRGDYVQNEVACDYNAGFQTSAIGLLHFKNVQHPAFA